MSTPGELLQAFGRGARARREGAQGPSVRTFRGRTVEEIIPMIQRELGAEAIIVRRRDGLTGGVLGFFQHAFVEIEAMEGAARVDVYDEAGSIAPDPSPAASPIPSPIPAQAAQLPRREPPPHERPPAQPRPAPTRSEELLRAATAAAAPQAGGLPLGRAQPQPPAGAPPRAPGSAYVTAHLASLARADRARTVAAAEQAGVNPFPLGSRAPSAPVVDFHELIPRDEPPAPVAPPAPIAPPPRLRASAPLRGPALERRAVAPGSHTRARAGVERGLRRLGISEELARELIEGATAHTLPLAPRAGLAQAVRTTLAQRIPVAAPLPTSGAAIVVVGAGGAGKTSCCAALLGAYRGSSVQASFAMLTRDADRGDLRLLMAPQIMKPLQAGTPRALRALRRARQSGLAIIDTPRVSPADKGAIRTLASVLAELEPERIVVALPATLGAAAAAQLLSALRPLGANALAVTHADETDQIGVAIEAACSFGLAPEYVLDRARSGGWRLRRLDPSELASRLLA